MKRNLLFTKFAGLAAILCFSLLFTNCSSMDEPVLEPDTRAGSSYLRVTCPATEFFIGQSYTFGLEMVDSDGSVLTFDRPSIYVTGGSYTVSPTGRIIFNEGAIYTVTASYQMGCIVWIADLEVNTTVFMRVESTWRRNFVSIKDPIDALPIDEALPVTNAFEPVIDDFISLILPGEVIFTNKLVFYADENFTRKVNVTKPVIARCCHYKPSQPGGPIYHPYWYTLYLNYPGEGTIVNGEHETMNTYGWLNSDGTVTRYSYISADISDQ